MLQFLIRWIELIFPQTCVVCNDLLRYTEKHVCTACLLDIPQIYMHNKLHNPLEELLWGQVHFARASAYMYYNSQSPYSHIILSFKYHNNYKAAIFMGELFGRELLKSGFLETIDCIIPLPLHKKKEKLRGYNQSYYIAVGIARVSGIAIEHKAVVRTIHTSTQTKKSKEERLHNVKDIFFVEQPERIAQKHVLLLDDIITTGATCISCGESILNQANVKQLSIAALGLATI